MLRNAPRAAPLTYLRIGNNEPTKVSSMDGNGPFEPASKAPNVVALRDATKGTGVVAKSVGIEVGLVSGAIHSNYQALEHRIGDNTMTSNITKMPSRGVRERQLQAFR